jgi:biopolymer transport protein ExbD
MRRVKSKTRREPTIALINIVFLMLIFFLVVGTLARPLDGDLQLVRTADLEGTAPPDTLVVHADGQMSFRGQPMGTVSEFLDLRTEEERHTVRVVPDRDLEAKTLVSLARELKSAGVQSVRLVTERGLE